MKHPYQRVQLTSPLRVLRGAGAVAAATGATTRVALATTTATAAIASERGAIIAPVVAVMVTRHGGLKVSVLVEVTDDVARVSLGDVVDRVVGQAINLEVSVVLVLFDDDASGIFKGGVGDEFLYLMLY